MSPTQLEILRATAAADQIAGSVQSLRVRFDQIEARCRKVNRANFLAYGIIIPGLLGIIVALSAMLYG